MADIYEKYKKHLTKAQVKALVEMEKKYRNLYAQQRAAAYGQLVDQTDSTQRALQNMGLAGRQGKYISGVHKVGNERMTRPYEDYNAVLDRAANAQLERQAVRMANQTIAARAKADYERRLAEQQKQMLAQQQAANQQYNNALWDRMHPNSPLARQNYMRTEYVQPKLSDMKVKVPEGTDARTAAHINREARMEYQQETRDQLRTATRLADLQKRINSDNKDDADRARTELGRYSSDEIRKSVASTLPKNIGRLVVLPDADFEMRYDAAQKAYANLAKEAERYKMAAGTNADYAIPSALRQKLDNARQTLAYFDYANKSRKYYIDENGVTHDITPEGRKAASYTVDNSLVPTAPEWANPKEWNGSNWKKAYDKKWNADQYEKDHDTKGSKYAALVNEWSLINGRTALLYTQEFQTAQNLGNAKEWIGTIFGGDINRNHAYNVFRDSCVHAFSNDYEDSTKQQKEQMDAMLTLANLMTDEERARFNTILEQSGGAAADKYFDHLYNVILPDRFAEYVQNEEAFDTRDTLGKIGQSILSVPVNLGQGVTAPIKTMTMQQDDPIAARLAAQKYNTAQGTRNAIANDLGTVGGFLYQTGMSMADSATVAMISSGIGNVLEGIGVAANVAGKVGSALGGSILGGSAFNSVYAEELQKGASPEAARKTAFGNGVNEMLFEALSLDMLVGQFQKGGILKVSKNAFVNWAVNALVQGGVEGSEEVFTDIANKLWDDKINGIYSEELSKIREYMANGYSYEQARKMVNEEFAGQLGASFLGGFISGGVMGGGASFMGMLQNGGFEKLGKGLRQNQNLMDKLTGFDFKSEAAQEILQQNKLTNMDVAELYSIMQQELLERYNGDIQKAVADGKITQEDANLIKQYEQNGVQITKDGKVVKNENGVTAEQYVEVQNAISQMDSAARIQLLDNEQMRQLIDAVGGDVAAAIDTRNTAEAEANRKYMETLAGIDADETMSDDLKQKRREAAERTKANEVSEARKEFDKSLTSKKLGKLEIDENGNIKTAKGSGTVSFDFSTEGHNTIDSMTADEQSALRLSQIAAASGSNVKVESEFVGEHANENGYYDWKTNTIHINMKGRNSVLWTLSHELTHYLAAQKTEAYNQLRDAIRDELQSSKLLTSDLMQKGFDYDLDNVDKYIEKTGNLYDALVAYERDERGYGKDAEEEVIARCCESFLADNVFVKAFASKHYKSAKTIAQFLARFSEDASRVVENAGERAYSEGFRFDESPERQILAQVTNIQKIAQIWEKAVNMETKKRNAAKEEAQKTATEIAAQTNGNMYSKVDRALAKRLDNEEHVKVYRAMQVIDGKLYPPMAARVAEERGGKRSLVQPTEIGQWYQSDERPDLIDPKTGKYLLDKANGSTISAAYNPYFHTSLSPLNDQFSSAYTRDNLVVVEGVVPKSELTSGYHAQYAKNSVGETEWHAGVVSSKLKTKRKVILSRWFKALRIMSNTEVAQKIAKVMEGETVAIPQNVVSPGLYNALNEAGVKTAPMEGVRRSSKADSVKSISDKEYMNLAEKYESGDKAVEAELRKAVDAAAKAAGYKYKGYHGTNALFNVFDPKKLGSKNFMAGSAYLGFFASASRETAESYTGLNDADVMSVFLGGEAARQMEAIKEQNGFDEADEMHIKAKEAFEKKYKESHGYNETVTNAVEQIMSNAKKNGIFNGQTEQYERDLAHIITQQFEADWNKQNYSAMQHEWEQTKEHKAYSDLNDKIINEWEQQEIKRRGYVPNVKDLYIKIDNPYIYDFEGEERDAESFAARMAKAKKDGNDGCIFKNVADGADIDTIYTVFSNTQFKSADLITKDEHGNIIPLSERFRTDRTGEDAWKNEDIRFSIADNVTLTDKEYEEKRDQYRKESASIKDELQDVRAKLQEVEQSASYKSAFERMMDKSLSDDEWKAAIDAFAKVVEESGHDALYKRQKELIEKQSAISKEWDKVIRGKELSDYRKAVTESGLTEAEYSRKQAVKEFGYTPYYYDAGYILPNGKMLNFSGEKGKHYGTRGQDHRAIGTIYPDSQGSDAMIRFMNDGNIRVMAETPGLDLCSEVEPTNEQYAVIKRFAEESRRKEYFSVDLSDKNGDNVGTLEYDGNVNPPRVVNDIRYFYQTGKIREQSSVAQFHYSKKDNIKLTSGGETRTFELGKTTAQMTGSAVDLEGGTVRNKVDMMQALAERYDKVYTDAQSEAEARAYQNAGAHRMAEEGGEFGTWEFTYKPSELKTDSQYDQKQKDAFARDVLHVVGTRKNFTYAQMGKYREALGRALTYLHSATFGKGDQMAAFDAVDRLFDRIINGYAELSEADEQMRDTILSQMRSVKDANGRTYKVLEVTDKQAAEIKNAYDNMRTFTAKLSRALGTRVAIKTVQNATMLENMFTHTDDSRFDSSIVEGDMPNELLRLAEQTKEHETHPYRAESEERAAVKESMWDKALEIVGAEKSATQKVREAVKETRAAERKAAKEKSAKAVDNARLAERMHEGALRAKDRRIAQNRETELKRRAAERETRLKQQFKETTQKASEARLKRDIRKTALKWNQRLVKMLANPTEASHVPVQLAREVAALTQTITEELDSTTERGRINLAKVAKAYEQAFKAQDTIKEAQKENPEYDPRGSILDIKMKDNGLVEMMDELNTLLAEKSFDELSAYEMMEFLNVVRGVANTVYNANRMIGQNENRMIFEVGDKLVNEMESAPSVTPDSKLGRALRGYLETSLDLRRMALMFSGSNENAEFVKLVNQLNDGAIEKARVARDLKAVFDPVTNKYGDEIRTWYGKKAEWIDTGLRQNGKKVEITKGMRVALALHVLNEGNMKHIENGGLTIPDRALYNEGKLSEAYAKKSGRQIVQMTADQINEIISHMTEAEKAYVEAAKEFFHNRTGYYVNRTSLQLLGYAKAIVDNYFPIHTNKNFTYEDWAQSMMQNASVEHQGFLKERADASNPIFLEDITSVVNRQIQGVSLYAGLAVPMRNFNAVRNSQVWHENEGRWERRTSVKETMIDKLGKYGYNIIDSVLKDLSEMPNVDVTSMEKFAGRLATNYVKAVLLGNLKVSLKQIASYPTAAAVIPWKYLGKALVAGGRNHRMISRADADLINQYTPLYQMRQEGYANEITSIMQKRGIEEKMPGLLGWITKMDVATVGRLWSAAEYMVADQTNLPVGSDAFYKEVAEVFNRTIQQTQPNFTPLQRNAALRSKNPLVRSLVLFGTQRMQNSGILIEAAMQLKNAKTKAEIQAARQKLGRAVASQIVQNILLLVASIGVDILRGRMKSWQDEDKEITAESVANGMGDMFLSNFVGSFLGGSELYSAISGLYKVATGKTAYDTEFTVPALDAIETLVNFVQSDLPNSIKYLSGDHTDEEKKKKLISFSMQLAKVAGYATGLPFENAIKDVFKGIIPAIQDVMDWKNTGELNPWLHQSGKLDKKKTNANYKEWTKNGYKGSEYFYWEKKLSDYSKRDDRAAVLMESDLPNEKKAMLLSMMDTSGATYNGTSVYRSNGDLYMDFANPTEKQKAMAAPSQAEVDLEAMATPEPTPTPNPLSDSKMEGVQEAVANGVDEQTAVDAFLTYQNIGAKEGRDDEFREWMFKNVKKPEDRATLELQVIGRAAKAEGAVTYRESGTVYRDYTNEAWYKLSQHSLAKYGTNKRYDAGKKLVKTGLPVEKTVAIYEGLKDLTKKAEWKDYLKKQGLTDEQINIFLWSRGWAK